MAVYKRRVRVAAPLDEVWEFYSRIEGLKALTPEWMGLSVEAVRGPDGEANPDVLDTGTEIRMAMQPLGVAPKQRWTSVVVGREEGDSSPWFRDEMIGGPFPRWVHTHEFYGDGDETVVSDTVEYELPGGELGRRASPLGRVGFEPMFRYRHRKTKQLLE
ncbi:SRPBCC family protein [Haloprofundus sp. MHR1]|uniref:SRPBCC family protein n=1 Tax=Haloprofundus sp. MHR1 TaxID=2572921 RepID=UPI0010BE5B94|nr:SRPBCC family protein [Haloprofundus sp. MHR1]QCJ45628.1 SRPBCC family protein [Haloprofundus sp. MHR1]